WLARRDALDGASAFAALGTARLEDGVVLLVPAGVRLELPIQIVHASSGASDPTLGHAWTLVVLERGAEAGVVELYCGPSGSSYLMNAQTRVFVGEDAGLTHARVQLDGDQAFHFGGVDSRQDRASRYRAHSFNLGARLARHDVNAVLDGEGGDCVLHGLFHARARQHVDYHTRIDHARAHCGSRELIKGILDGQARSVFHGRIVVRRGAQRTDAKQSNPNLLLSAGALAQTRPQLEIYADDVKCTHGATIGRLDDEALFYLRSRGLGREEARRLVVAAFAGEVLADLAPAALRAGLERELSRRLDESVAAEAA
ncbi:MAG TPA: Fe-S cluster assembly protein SufD, partial [Candidatus Polarisedimenticolaceae bacterium]|nr:Fe-S cluster assembly protein SufD [Candidatus Polarisedimenticolaceae bacterium]